MVRSHELSMLKMRLRSTVTRWLGEYPLVYFPLARGFSNPVRDGKAPIVTPTTDVVVEGFPGSGNTFAVAALATSQADGTRIAHHLHVPAQIKRAIRLEKPILVVVRPPKDAISSFLVRATHLQPQLDRITWEYARYHRFLHSRQDHVVIAEFEEVTRNFGAVVNRLNRKFAIGLAPFDHNDENVRRCFDWIDGWYRLGGWIDQRARDGRGIPDLSRQAPGPSAKRHSGKEALAEAFEKPRVAEALRAADAAYEMLLPHLRDDQSLGNA